MAMLQAEIVRLRRQGRKRQRPASARGDEANADQATQGEAEASARPRAAAARASGAGSQLRVPKRVHSLAGAEGVSHGQLAAAAVPAAKPAVEQQSALRGAEGVSRGQLAAAAVPAAKPAVAQQSAPRGSKPVRTVDAGGHLVEALRGALRVGSRKWDDGCHGNAVCHGLQALRGNGTMARGAWSVGALASAIVEIVCGASERANAGGDSQPADAGVAGMCAAVQDPACARVLWQLTALLHALTGDPELTHCGLGPQLRSALEAIALNAAAEVAESGGCSTSGAPHANGSALQALLTKDGAFRKVAPMFLQLRSC